jgi:hypothetical protein
VTAQDIVAPIVTNIPAGFAMSYIVTFSEPMDEVTAVTLANYTLVQGSATSVPPTVNSAVLNAGLTTVTLTLSESTVSGNILTVTGVKDIAGNTMTSTSNASRTF